MQTITRSRYLSASGTIMAMLLTLPLPVQAEGVVKSGHLQSEISSMLVPPKTCLESRPYLKERRRHDRIRGRADILSKNPLLSSYQAQAAELRAEDDRKMEELDLLTKSTGRYAVALAMLKKHNEKMLRMVRKAQAFAGD